MGRRSDNLSRVTPYERANLTRRYPAWILASTLCEWESWWHHVEQVQGGRDVLEVARLYVPRAGTGRKVVEEMLVRASRATSREEARMNMAPIILAFGDHPLHEGDPQRFVRGAPGDPDDRSLRPPSKARKPGSYDGWDLLAQGAVGVARRGAGECLRCKVRLRATQTSRPRYCDPCRGIVTPEEDRYARRAMNTVLKKAEYGVFETGVDDFQKP
jgi:hypothetical protein